MSRYEYAIAPTSQFYFCGIPFRLDTTPKCRLNCLYCFAMARGGRRTAAELYADPAALQRKMERALTQKEVQQGKLSLISEFLSRKTPIHFGGISDPFSDARAERISATILCSLKEYDYPVVLSTKNPIPLVSEWFLACPRQRRTTMIQVSITTMNKSLALALEPNAPPPAERIKAISALSRQGFHIAARIQPLLIDRIPEIKDELIPLLGDIGVEHVILEFLKLPVEKNVSMISDFIRKTAIDYYSIYSELGMNLIGREWILANSPKWDLLSPLVEHIHHNGMTYGAADYGLNHLGDTDSCCGIDRIPGFENWFKCNFTYLIRNTVGNEIYFGTLCNEWSPSAGLRKYINSNCRIATKSTMIEYLRAKWNHPNTSNSPDSFLGVVNAKHKDEAGDLIYERGRVQNGQ